VKVTTQGEADLQNMVDMNIAHLSAFLHRFN
jgi:hypothetical protein